MIDLSYLIYLGYYLAIALFFLLFNAMVAGYFGEKVTNKDYWESLVWPVSFTVFLGVCFRVISDNRYKFFKLFRKK